MKENIVKQVCKELGINQEELSEKLNISISTIQKASSSGDISPALQGAINLLIENNRLNKELEDYQNLKKIIANIVKSEENR